MRTSTAAWMLLTTALASAGATLWMTRPAPVASDLLDPIVLVGEIQALAELQTIAVPLQTTVHGARGEGVLRTLAGEELVFQGIGEARAGVDLGELGPEDVWIDGEGTVWVDLPPGEIFAVDLDERRSQVLAREQGWFGRADRHFETEARRAALTQLTAQAEILGLEAHARDEAEIVLSDLLQTLGADHVRFAPAGSGPYLSAGS